MGGSLRTGGMWPEQISRDEFEAKGVGRPSPLASGVTFIPLQVQASPVGNPEDADQNDSEKPPALLIRLVVAGGQVRTHSVPLRHGLSLKHYLREAGLIGARMRLALNINGKKRVQMSYVPQVGETLNMVPPQRPLLQLRSP